MNKILIAVIVCWLAVSVSFLTARAEPGKINISAMYIDMDRTLLDSHHKISPKTALALKRYKECGGEYGIATARGPEQVREYLSMIQPTLPFVFNNGGLVMTTDLRQTIKINSFPRQVLDAAKPLSILIKEKIIGITLTTNHGIISDRNNQDFLKFIKEFGFIPERVDSSFSLSDDEFPISLMYWTKPNEENGIKKMVGKAVRNRASVVTSRECVFVTAKIANKAVGIKQALAGTEMSLSENVVTIGDSNNDIEMLKGARYGFAMGNCTPLACQAADAIIGSNDSDAIARLIEKIMISGGCSY